MQLPLWVLEDYNCIDPVLTPVSWDLDWNPLKSVDHPHWLQWDLNQPFLPAQGMNWFSRYSKHDNSFFLCNIQFEVWFCKVIEDLVQFRGNLLHELYMTICSLSKELGVKSCSGFELLKGSFFLISLPMKRYRPHQNTAWIWHWMYARDKTGEWICSRKGYIWPEPTSFTH